MTKKEALKKAGYVPKVGRPRIGDATLPAIAVSKDLRLALESRAKALNTTLADVRRQAYQAFLIK